MGGRGGGNKQHEHYHSDCGFKAWHNQKNVLGTRVTEKPVEERPKPLLYLPCPLHPPPNHQSTGAQKGGSSRWGTAHQLVLHTGVLFLVADKAGGLVFWGDWCHCCPLKGSSLCITPLPHGSLDFCLCLFPLVPLGHPARAHHVWICCLLINDHLLPLRSPRSPAWCLVSFSLSLWALLSPLWTHSGPHRVLAPAQPSPSVGSPEWPSTPQPLSLHVPREARTGVRLSQPQGYCV